MVHSHSFARILVSLLLLALAAPLQADITPSGDVDPTIPDNLGWWTGGGDISTRAYIGKTAAGSVTVNLGSDLSSCYGYIGYETGSTGVVTVDGGGSTWASRIRLYVGDEGHGTLNITNGGAVSNNGGYIGSKAGSTGVVTVAGSGSTWTNSGLYVGETGTGTLNILNGGAVSNTTYGYIGFEAGSAGVVTVDGSGSTWTNHWSLYVGRFSHGTLNITGGGLVSVANTLTIDENGGGNGFINMATGGMLALYGDADDSLTDFLNLIDGTGAIHYWDGSDWADITGATHGEDYTLTYLTEGDLADYTMLTVPEPASATILLLGTIVGVLRRRKK